MFKLTTMKKQLLPVVLLFLLLVSCKKDTIRNLDSISYGTSFGMCVGYCKQSIAISNERVTFSKSKYVEPDTKTCTAAITTAEVDELKHLLNKAMIMKMPEVIGCPDCADGGAEWIAINADGKQHKVTFEYGNAPTELAEAVAKLRLLKASFDNCN